MSAFIEIKNLDFSYEGEVIFKDLNLSIEGGSCHTVLGDSGRGKSTLLHLIAGFLEPQNGAIFIDGQCVYSSNEKINISADQRRVGIVFQDHSLFPHLNVLQNIMIGCQNDQQKALKYLELVGLSDLKEKSISEISGGQKQRIAIARALANEPKVILLDEAFSSLDAQLRAELRSDVVRLIKETGLTSLFVTHSQSEAFAISDSMTLLLSGFNQQTGAPFEVIERPRNSEVVKFLDLGICVSGKVLKREDCDNDRMYFIPYKLIDYSKGPIEGVIKNKLFDGKCFRYEICSDAGCYKTFCAHEETLSDKSEIGTKVNFGPCETYQLMPIN